jgi:hypothetical protein
MARPPFHSTLNIEHPTFNIQHSLLGSPRQANLLDAPARPDYCSSSMPIEPRQPQGLVDILDKILDKGLVVAGDIKVSLANVELLTIQLRLVICSIDKAEAIGINWWRSDRFYSAAPNAVSNEEYDALKARVNELEAKLEARALPRASQLKDERKGR